MTKKLFSELLGEVWSEGMKPTNIVRGFETTGLFPINAKRFPESEIDPIALKRFKETQNETTNLSITENAAGNSSHNEEPNLSTLTTDISIAGPSGTSKISCAPEPLHKNSQDISNLNSEPDKLEVVTDVPPSAIPSHSTPIKSVRTSTRTSKVTPSTKIGIFAEHSNNRCIDQARVEKVKKPIIPRLKPQKYGEILTNQAVLDKLEAAQNLKNQKKKTNRKQKDEPEKKSQGGKTRKNVHNIEEEEEDEEVIDESALCQDDSSDDQLESIEESIIAEATNEVEYHEPIWNELKPGLFVLVDFTGGQRNKVHYKYVCCIQNINQDEEDADIVVQGFERFNSPSTDFVEKPNDVCTITFEMIKAILPEPNLKYCERQIVYVFPGTVAVFEK